MDRNLLFSLTEKELNRMLEVSYCTAKDETRPILQGLCFNAQYGKLDTVGLDGYRVSKRSIAISNQNSFNFVLTPQSIKEIHKITNKNGNELVDVYLAEFEIVKFIFTRLNETIECKLMKDDYVKYDSIIPEDNEIELQINAKEITKCILDIKKSNASIIKLLIFDDKITVKGQPVIEEYSEELSLESQRTIQVQNNIDYEVKSVKWTEKVRIATEKCKTAKGKEPVLKIAKFHKINKRIEVAELIFEFPCKINKPYKMDEEFEIGFNPKYLYEAIKQYKNEITLKFISRVTPCTITIDNKNLDMILPMRIRK